MTKFKFILSFVLGLFILDIESQEINFNVEQSTVAWTGTKIGGQHQGFIKLKNASLEIENNQIISGQMTIDMNSISCTDLTNDTYNKKLVSHLKSDDFFGVKDYPEASFKITDASEFNNTEASVKGEITIKGKTEILTFTVKKNKNEYKAKIEIDRSKFNVRYGSTSFFESLGDKAIDDIFTLDINLKPK